MVLFFMPPFLVGVSLMENNKKFDKVKSLKLRLHSGEISFLEFEKLLNEIL